MHVSKGDIELLATTMVCEHFDDDEGVMGIASAFVTQKRAAKYLEITLPTLRKYVKMGFITRFKVDGRFYFYIRELEKAKKNIF